MSHPWLLAPALMESSCQLKRHALRLQWWALFSRIGESENHQRGGWLVAVVVVGGTVWLHLAEQEGDVIHQKRVTATVKCWKDIWPLVGGWGDEWEPEELNGCLQ